MTEHSTSDHGHHDGHDHDHGISHVTPVPLLLGVFGALLVLTWITVAVTAIDLGPVGNIAVGMVIATVKASLVGLYFMHLRWEKPLNVIVAVSSLLFALLFVAITLIDRNEYQEDIIWGDDTEDVAS